MVEICFNYCFIKDMLNIDDIFSFVFLQVISSYEYTNVGPER